MGAHGGPTHSRRSTLAGSHRVARQAGSRLAASVDRKSVVATPTMSDVCGGENTMSRLRTNTAIAITPGLDADYPKRIRQRQGSELAARDDTLQAWRERPRLWPRA
jgi:hypothetical protein